MVQIMRQRPANMMMNRQLSSIQMIQESLRRIDTFKNNIREWISKYDTKNIIFSEDMREVTEGLFEVRFESANLEEALNNISIGEAIQIKGLESKDRVYRVGTVKSSLTECRQDKKVVDARNFEEINEAKFNPSKAIKWLDNSKNQHSLLARHCYDLDLVIIAFNYVKDLFKNFEFVNIDEVIDYMEDETFIPELIEYVEDEFDDIYQIKSTDWKEFLNDIIINFKQLYK